MIGPAGPQYGTRTTVLGMEGPSRGAGPKQMEGPSRGAGPKQAVQMLNDRVLVQIPRGEGECMSRAGIVIPATAQVARRLGWAEVVAVGPQVRAIKTGDQVLFNPEDRFEVEVAGEDYLILRERDIHAVASERVDDGTGLYL